MMAILTQIVFLIPEQPVGLATEFQDPVRAEALTSQSGMGNPVTAVLLNFRAYDTLLELTVLMFALLGTQVAVAASREREQPGNLRNPLLSATVGIIVPISFLVAGDLLWAGADHPGGAFQAGAVLGGAGIMLLLAGRLRRLTTRSLTVRLGAVAGAATFLLIGIGPMGSRGRFVQFPSGAANPLILVIEAATAASVPVIFVLLFQAVCDSIDLDEPDGSARPRGDPA
jgi:multisubunit Na+/H+ antiporter MnhB subunit